MKKIILITVFALGFIMNLNAQNDGFFSSASAYTEYREEAWWQGGVPSLPGTHGVDYDMLSVFYIRMKMMSPITVKKALIMISKRY